MHRWTTHLAAIALSLALTAAAAHAQYQPSEMYGSLLTNISLIEKTGKFDLGNQIQVVFVKENQQGTIAIRKADGTVLFTQEWYAETVREPYYLIVQTKTMNSSGETVYEMKLDPGDYAIDFNLEGTKFYTFPFSVKKNMPSDPFAGGAYYTLEGDWQDWAYLFNYDAEPDKNLDFRVFLRMTDPDKREKDAKIDVRIVRDKDKKLICGGPGGQTTFTLNHTWIRYSIMMSHPEGKAKYGEYFKAKDMLAMDGDYTITMDMNGSTAAVWKASVKNGKFGYAGRTVRGVADPLTFIEGGKDAWWYKRVK